MISRVVITRPVGPYAGGRKLASQLEEGGYEVFELPLLECVPAALSASELQPLRSALAGGSDVWLAFLSPTAVWVWRELLKGSDPSLALTAKVRIAVQGRGTAEAVQECFGRKPDFIPAVFVAEEFAREFAERVPRRAEVFAPQSADGRDIFVPTLRSLGFKAFGLVTYGLKPASLSAEKLRAYREFVNDRTALVFMSPSAVKAAAAELDGNLGTELVVSVGPITSQALKAHGFPIWGEAQEHSEAGVLEVLRQSA